MKPWKTLKFVLIHAKDKQHKEEDITPDLHISCIRPIYFHKLSQLRVFVLHVTFYVQFTSIFNRYVTDARLSFFY